MSAPRVLALIAGLSAPQAQGPIPEAIDATAQRQLDAIVRAQVDPDRTPAVYAAVSIRGRIVAVSAAGRKRLDGEATASAGDRLMIGSISKGVTATVIASLVGQGKLRWESRVRDILPDFVRLFPDHPALEADYVDLIGHASGLPRGDESAHTEGTAQSWRRHYAEAMFGKPMLGTFRGGHYYSGGGTVAALMAERTLGVPFEDLCAKNLFGPLGMLSFGWGKPWETHKEQPVGIVVRDGARSHPGKNWNEYIRHDPSGGMHCTIADLCRFATIQAVGETRTLGGLSSDAIKTMHRRLSTTPGSGGGATGLGDYSQVYVDPERQFAIVCIALLDMDQGGKAKVETVIAEVKRLFYGHGG